MSIHFQCVKMSIHYAPTCQLRNKANIPFGFKINPKNPKINHRNIK